jgi:hypothetical protein
MTNPQLTVEKLIEGGFREVGCWELTSAGDLTHKIDLPTCPGVYAFAIDGVVQYVGLASRSLRQRLAFYRKPGVSQRTNVRLNGTIRGHLHERVTIRILIAHPPDQSWMGFCIKGAEGLEAGLISEFDLPWNMRGAPPRAHEAAASRGRRAHSGSVAGQIIELVKNRPGMTELEISKAIFRRSAVQQQVNQHCRALLKTGQLQRRGRGGASDPFTYDLTQ